MNVVRMNGDPQSGRVEMIVRAEGTLSRVAEITAAEIQALEKAHVRWNPAIQDGKPVSTK